MFDVLPLDPTITIRAISSVADPDTCKFTVSQMVQPGGPFFFHARELAAGSPLAEQLFALSGVAHVLIVENVVTVGKNSVASWSALKSAIGTVIRAHLVTGVAAILAAPGAAGASGRTDAELRTVIQELLDVQVNRAIAAHGGKISIVDVKERNLSVTMSGGCQGCAASQLTLRRGFEVKVRRVAPEIVAIVDMTDHDAGKKPFYHTTG
ncbi:MAG: NifU family protein [Polaromonas sp.]|nr:NifU family protein [Gemmatimonadaceae bacterium]